MVGVAVAVDVAVVVVVAVGVGVGVGVGVVVAVGVGVGVVVGVAVAVGVAAEGRPEMNRLDYVFALLFASACSETPGCASPCDSVWSVQQDPACWSTTPCADFVHGALNRSTMACRPDQSASVTWEPALTGARNDDEERVGGMVVCRCTGASPSDLEDQTRSMRLEDLPREEEEK